LLDALHSEEHKLVVRKRTEYAEQHFRGYDRWRLMWIYNSQMSVADSWWLNAADDLEDKIGAVARQNYNNAMAHEYGYCPNLECGALSMSMCVCDECFDETRPLRQQYKYPTQPGAPLAKLMLNRQRGVPLPLDLKHIRWGVFHEQPFEPEPLKPLPTRLVMNITSYKNDEMAIYPPKGSQHEHTFQKKIPEHILGILNLSVFFGHDDRSWIRNDPVGITRKYLKRLLVGSPLTPGMRKKALSHRQEMVNGDYKHYYKSRHEAAMNIQCIAREAIARRPRSVEVLASSDARSQLGGVASAISISLSFLYRRTHKECSDRVGQVPSMLA
jgi:hypothetical protein